MRAKNIYQAVGAFGGSSFRAIKCEKFVRIQESRNGANWRVIATTNPEHFYELAELHDIWNPYNSDPAHLLNIANSINE